MRLCEGHPGAWTALMWLIYPELHLIQSWAHVPRGATEEEKSSLSSLSPVVPFQCFLPTELPGK